MSWGWSVPIGLLEEFLICLNTHEKRERFVAGFGCHHDVYVTIHHPSSYVKNDVMYVRRSYEFYIVPRKGCRLRVRTDRHTPTVGLNIATYVDGLFSYILYVKVREDSQQSRYIKY